MSNQSFAWSECVADFKDQDVSDFCAWRGYDAEMVRWLRQQEEIGKYYVPRRGWCVALPVRDDNGYVYRCHCRERHDFTYWPNPDDRPISALVLGWIKAAKMIFVHESEWDALAQVSTLGLWNELDLGEICIIATRGACGMSRLEEIDSATKTGIYVVPQNDSASEKWLKACIEQLGQARVVRIPAQHKDLNDWIRAKDFSADQLEYTILQAKLEKCEPPKSKFPEIITGEQMRMIQPPIPPDIITGILAQGEKGSLAGGAKAFKTWTLIHQSLSIAAGVDWWGFRTMQSNVLYLNLELPAPYFEQRVHTVAFRMGIEIPDNLYVWHLRRAKLGDPQRWLEFLEELSRRCQAIHNPFIAMDPIYKLLGGRDENRAGDVGTLLEQIDDVVELSEGSNMYGHHNTKGNQAAKEAIDRASGSGVFSRDPDTILPMTAHEKPGAFVIEPILRNHSPVMPFVMEWQYPLFERNPLLDPGELKQPKARPSKYDPHMLAFWLGTKRLKSKQFATLVGNETGMSRATFYELLKKAEAVSLIKRDPTDKDYWIKK
jgi:hypothetical protein